MDEILAQDLLNILMHAKPGRAGLQVSVPVHLYLHKSRTGQLSLYSTEEEMQTPTHRFVKLGATTATFQLPSDFLANIRFLPEPL